MRKREKTEGGPEFLGWAVKGASSSRIEMGEAAGAQLGDSAVRSSVLDMSAFEVPVRHPHGDIQVGTVFKTVDSPTSCLSAIDTAWQQSPSQGSAPSIRCLPPGSLRVDVASGGRQNTCTTGLTGEGELLPELTLLFFFTKSMAVFWQPGSHMYTWGRGGNAVPKNPDAPLETVGLVACFQFKRLRVVETRI